MPYIVFARKWRPQNFDDVVGQDSVITTLKNAVKSNRLAHAYIFAGPRGVGKTSTARILAKSLNCEKGLSLIPCNKCASCVEITEGRSLDVIEIDGASNRGIDEIRALRENVKFSPAQGRYKIYIIDEVHMLTTEAFNALLKTLEEPPAHVKFIFATTHPQKILPTIISRCQFFEFRRVSTITIIEKLKDIAGREKISVGDDVLLAVAKASEGSLRDAESVLDELVSFTGGAIRLEDVNSILGIVEQEFLFEIADKIINKDTAGCLRLLDNLIDQGKDPNQLLLNLIEHFRNLMIVKVTSLNHEKLLDLPGEVCGRIVRQSKKISLDNILLGFNVLLNAQEMARRIENLRIPLEVALVKLSSQDKIYDQNNAPQQVKKIDEADKKENSRQEFVPPKPAVNNSDFAKDTGKIEAEINLEDALKEPADSKGAGSDENKDSGIDFDNIKNLWPEFMKRLGKVKVSAAHYLESGSPIKSSGSVLTIGFLKNLSFQKEALERKENLAILEQVWHELLQQDIKINFVLTRDDDNLVSEAEEMDPLVQSALDTFSGKIIKRHPADRQDVA